MRRRLCGRKTVRRDARAELPIRCFCAGTWATRHLCGSAAVL